MVTSKREEGDENSIEQEIAARERLWRTYRGPSKDGPFVWTNESRSGGDY